MITCNFCGHTDTPESDDFQLDTINNGFWCEVCDGYTYLNGDSSRHKFTLILEDKNAYKVGHPIHKLKLAKRISPYRYPGGKSKIIDYLFTHLQESKTDILVSPFTGGGSFELAMLDSNVVKQLHLNDLDTGVYSFWWVTKYMPYALVDRIQLRLPNHKDYFEAQRIIKSDYKGVDVVDAAWASLLVNRLAYSGVFKANPLGGKNGTSNDLLARWNPKELIKRIKRIHAMSDKIIVTQENAVKLIEETYWQNNTTIFIDPPYVEKGKDLYHCFYTKEDHIELSIVLESLHFGCPGADILLTYDYNKWLSSLYHLPKLEVIGRQYSA